MINGRYCICTVPIVYLITLEDGCVTKTKIDVLMMIVAIVVSGFLSINNNPLLGVALLIGILSAWSFVPKVPRMIKSRIKK